MITQTQKANYGIKEYNDFVGLSGDVKPHYVDGLKFNQLISNGNFVDTTGWSAIRGTISAENNVLTYTITEAGTGNNNRVIQSVSFTAGHKYFLTAQVRTSASKQIRFASATPTAVTFSFSETLDANTWTTIYTMATIGYDNTSFYAYANNNNTIDDTVEFKNIMLIDLTEMYGNGNEPTDTATILYDCKAIGYDLAEYQPKVSNAPIKNDKVEIRPLNADRFYEIDTAKFYRYDGENNKWYAQS